MILWCVLIVVDCVILKVSHLIRYGDTVNCTIAELQPLRAEPEDIPLDIVYEDEHVIVVNKPAHMVCSQCLFSCFLTFCFLFYFLRR